MFYLFVQRKFHNLNHVLCMIFFFFAFHPSHISEVTISSQSISWRKLYLSCVGVKKDKTYKKKYIIS